MRGWRIQCLTEPGGVMPAAGGEAMSKSLTLTPRLGLEDLAGVHDLNTPV